jgi:hypothetical protein
VTCTEICTRWPARHPHVPDCNPQAARRPIVAGGEGLPHQLLPEHTRHLVVFHDGAKIDVEAGPLLSSGERGKRVGAGPRPRTRDHLRPRLEPGLDRQILAVIRHLRHIGERGIGTNFEPDVWADCDRLLQLGPDRDHLLSDLRLGANQRAYLLGCRFHGAVDDRRAPFGEIDALENLAAMNVGLQGGLEGEIDVPVLRERDLAADADHRRVRRLVIAAALRGAFALREADLRAVEDVQRGTELAVVERKRERVEAPHAAFHADIASEDGGDDEPVVLVMHDVVSRRFGALALRRLASAFRDGGIGERDKRWPIRLERYGNARDLRGSGGLRQHGCRGQHSSRDHEEQNSRAARGEAQRHQVLFSAAVEPRRPPRRAYHTARGRNHELF